MLYNNGPILAPPEGDAPYEVLAVFRGEVAGNNTPTGLMVDTPAIVAARYGRGRVIWCSPHPEQSDGLDYMIAGALRWLADPDATLPGTSACGSPPQPCSSVRLEFMLTAVGAGAGRASSRCAS